MLQVKRELRRAKLFSIQKITKRVKQLERKKGTEAQLQKNCRKAKRLVDELELIKELNLNDLASEVFQAYTEGTFAANSKSTHGEDPQERAKWRLLSSRQFQLGLRRVKQTTFRPPVAQVPSVGSIVPSQTSHSGTSSDDDSDAGDTGSDSAAIQESVIEEEDGSSDLDLELGSSDTTAAVVSLKRKNGHLVSVKSMKKRKSPAKHCVSTKRLPKAVKKSMYSSEEGIGGSLTDEYKRSRAVKLDSMFLESLDFSSKSEGTKVQKKKKKNRLGQRARKSLVPNPSHPMFLSRSRGEKRDGCEIKAGAGTREWEKLYRAQARHLQKHKQQSDRVTISSKSSKANSKGSSNTSRSSTHHFQAATTATAVDSEGLHPSWAASRRKKAQERGIQEFQGQKIVFSDSD